MMIFIAILKVSGFVMSLSLSHTSSLTHFSCHFDVSAVASHDTNVPYLYIFNV